MFSLRANVLLALFLVLASGISSDAKLSYAADEGGLKLYVGNLDYNVRDSDLHDLFEKHGVVRSVQVIIDRETGRSKGFGFVEMASKPEAENAIAALNGSEFLGRRLTVNEARPRGERRSH
jgi:cold-inducible RNA-binding protein